MKKLLCALLCLTLLCGSVSAFAASEKTGTATITMNLDSFYIWSIPVDKDVVLFEKTLWGNVYASNILLQPGYELNLYMGYGDGFALKNTADEGKSTIPYNLYNVADASALETAVALAEADFTAATFGDVSDKVNKLATSTLAKENNPYGEKHDDVLTTIYYETTATPPTAGTYEDTVTFYAVAEAVQKKK